MEKLDIKLKSLKDLDALAKILKLWIDQEQSKEHGIVFALIGNLGAGKTALAKSLLKAAGVKKRVTSPTFVLMNAYAAGRPKKNFYHLDAYRTTGFRDIAALGITDIWRDPQAVAIIEWADKIKAKLPQQTIYIYMSANSDGSHKAQIANAPLKLRKMLKLLKLAAN